jgi:hypothetical protein
MLELDSKPSETAETPAEASATVKMPPEAPTAPPADEQIAALAKALWEERGCPEGSSEVDWFEAEQRLRSKQTA